jgi:serine kinase of HPr protein (carbohydrate metabolism regulator)
MTKQYEMLSFNYHSQPLNMILSQFDSSSILKTKTKIKNNASYIHTYIDTHQSRQCVKHGVLLE